MRGLSSPVKKRMDQTPVDRRLVIHAGPHKTATTYIQENLFGARGALAKAGWFYPFDPEDGRSGQHDLAHEPELYFEKGAPRRRVLNKWAKKAEDRGYSVVFSAEGLCRWEHEHFDTLAENLGFDTYEIIYAVRDPFDLFPSLWAEEVKHGLTMSFPERFARVFAQSRKSRLLNPIIDLTPWLQKKNAHVHVIPYDILKRNRRNICKHIVADILKVPNFKPSVHGLVNKKNALEITEFMRFITLIHYNGAERNGPELRTRFMELLTPEYAEEIRQLMMTDGRPARKAIPVRGDLGFRNAIEANLKDRLGKNWSYEVPPDESLFSKKDRGFPYYSEYILSTTPSVMKAADDILKKMFS